MQVDEVRVAGALAVDEGFVVGALADLRRADLGVAALRVDDGGGAEERVGAAAAPCVVGLVEGVARCVAE